MELAGPLADSDEPLQLRTRQGGRVGLALACPDVDFLAELADDFGAGLLGLGPGALGVADRALGPSDVDHESEVGVRSLTGSIADIVRLSIMPSFW
jgi:hypothetical protein